MLHEKKTPAQVEHLIAQKQDALQTVRAEITKLEAEFAQASVADDEVALKRIHQRRDTARAEMRKLQDQIAVLEGARRLQEERQVSQQYAQQLAKADGLLEQRVKLAAEIDEWIAAGGTLFKRINDLNGAAIQALPRIPDDVPACFNLRSVQNVVGLKLYGSADGLFLPRSLGLENPHTARQQPGLKARLTEERSRIMAQLAPPITPEAA